MRKFTIIVTGGSAEGQHEFEVHRKGCLAAQRDAQNIGFNSYDVEGESAEAVIAGEVEVFIQNEQDWYAKDFKVHNCCRR